MSAPSPAELAQLATAATHLEAAKYYDLAAFVMLLYDTLLTIPREVDKIWKKHWTGVTLLWFLNRWIFILAVVPTIVAFHDPGFMGKTALHSRCERFFRYAGYIATFQRVVIGSVFILRTYCIYGRNLVAAGFIAIFLIAEVFCKLYANLKWGAPVVLPKGFVACVLAVAPENAHKFAIFWISELCTDAVVLTLTIYRSYVVSRMQSVFHSTLLRVIARDGIVYFLIMFLVNLTTVLFDLIASQDLKAINANFGVMINCIMTGRLILNLKSATSKPDPAQVSYAGYNGVRNNFEARILGNIGNDLEDESHVSSTLTGSTLVSQTGRNAHWDRGCRSIDYNDGYELSVRRPQGYRV
ncbi:uncharacterized protein FOMMEDRAFT_160173 [Fomitiporia mediterranea MF3/22]|uniref:uncharacterized protein n=1 Tax=Fomitiporia mediterranea (strain MF3/22) TaxID=694068 RepID=UPI0004408CC8|nr:uncharacterized protein FOMMEDRAFT_160173 [Fomitiporia mediterranea MF3/22]EJC99729.1 hypothetical protein FOMMEDRAFT_160173 [Fomitiporia mediterranea MF3/22]